MDFNDKKFRQAYTTTPLHSPLSVTDIFLNDGGKQKFCGSFEFDALVGFVDMRGFTVRVRGLAPTKVRDFAMPFVSSVIEVSARHHCFIDKVIGDEVMIVMPCFTKDNLATGLIESSIAERLSPLPSLKLLLCDLFESLQLVMPKVGFTAGFAFGPVTVDRIGSATFYEWSVWGNCVNAAKRLQNFKEPTSIWRRLWKQLAAHCRGLNGCDYVRFYDALEVREVTVGSLTDEKPNFQSDLLGWIRELEKESPLRLYSSHFFTCELQGVGKSTFVRARLGTRSESHDLAVLGR